MNWPRPKKELFTKNSYSIKLEGKRGKGKDLKIWNVDDKKYEQMKKKEQDRER